MAIVAIREAPLQHGDWFCFCGIHCSFREYCILRMATYLENLEKSGNFSLVRERSGKLWFACDVLPQL